MKFTQDEKRTIYGIFHELLKMPYSKLNTFLGSVTIQEMTTIYNKLRFEKYCETHGISYEDMTEDDLEDAIFEELREQGYAV